MKKLAYLLGVTLLLAACGQPAEKPKEKPGLRIVSVSKQLTEIIFAVGGDTALVGRDISSTWPAEAKKITAVGYHRALAPEGIISLNPTAVWNDGNWGPQPLRVMVIHFGQAANQYFVLSHRGIQQQMLDWAGAVNAADTAQKWKNLSAEVVAQCQPDVILATDYGYDLQGSLEKFKQLPGVALSPAAKNNRIYRIEEHDLVYLGPRTGQNVYDLIRLIHGK
jgi:ABC-type hemin transport system substrate-binding protein